MRFAVTGGRNYTDVAAIRSALSVLPADAVMVNGDGPGLDHAAGLWWEMEPPGRAVEHHPAMWDDPCGPTCAPGHRRTVLGVANRCPAKGPLRNQEMVDSGLDLLIAFPGGRGTADMIRRCRGQVPVRDVAGVWGCPS